MSVNNLQNSFIVKEYNDSITVPISGSVPSPSQPSTAISETHYLRMKHGYPHIYHNK